MSKSYNLRALSILIIDDNDNMCSIIKTVLIALGIEHFNIKVCRDAVEALRELRMFPADIAICDWKMEPLDGLDFARMIRTGKDSPNTYLPIIMLTGFTEMSRVMEARDAGVNEFMAKPISAKGLYLRICSIVDHPREYIRTKGRHSYFGPDRRRKKNDPSYNGVEQRKAD